MGLVWHPSSTVREAVPDSRQRDRNHPAMCWHAPLLDYLSWAGVAIAAEAAAEEAAGIEHDDRKAADFDRAPESHRAMFMAQLTASWLQRERLDVAIARLLGRSRLLSRADDGGR